jgi:hypothetical protein
MSRLAEYRKLEVQLKAQMAELEAMRNDKSLKKEGIRIKWLMGLPAPSNP